MNGEGHPGRQAALANLRLGHCVDWGGCITNPRRRWPGRSWFKREHALGENSQGKRNTSSRSRAETSPLPTGRPSDVATFAGENWTSQSDSLVECQCSLRQLRKQCGGLLFVSEEKTGCRKAE